MNKKQAWRALQAFYKLKSLLLPSFIERNKRSLNSIEAELTRQYQEQYERDNPALLNDKNL